MKKIIIAVVLAVVLVAGGFGSSALAADSGSMEAMHQRFYKADILDPNCDSVEPDQTLAGNYGWHLHIGNNTGGQVTSPSISVTSSLSPTLFPAVESWPYEVSRDSLEDGERWIMFDLKNSELPVEFQTGYRVSRTTTGSWMIPPGGGEQEVEVTVTPLDGRYHSEGYHTLIRVDIDGNVVLGSNTQPVGAKVFAEEGKHIAWDLPGAPDIEIGTEYKFTVRLQVDNPLDVSILHKPSVHTFMEVEKKVAEVTSTSVSISDPSYPVLKTTYSVTGDQQWKGVFVDAWQVRFAKVPNIPPVAQASVDPYLAPVGSDFTFDGSASSGAIVSYDWDFGDGSSGSGVSVTHAYTEPGIYNALLTVTDDMGAQSTDTVMVVVYDPEAGFVTGAGWIYSKASADRMNPSAEGKATFGFVSKYKKGATEPTGQTEFQFKAGDLNFHSTQYQWLVVNQSGTNALFKGTGTVNGTGEYKFMLWAGDGDPDKFYIKIWEEEDENGTETVRYSNGFDQPIGGGSIVIHAKK